MVLFFFGLRGAGELGEAPSGFLSQTLTSPAGA